MTHITDWIQKHIGIGGVLAFAIFAQLIGVIFVSILPLAVCGENTAEAVKTVVAKGDAAAQFRYAEMLRDGRGVAKNMKEAAKWTRSARWGSSS